MTRRALALVFALALALRLAVLPWTLPRYDWGRAYPDTAQYEAMARNLLEGKGLSAGPGARAVRPPLYPLLLAALRAPLAVILVQCVMGAATAVLAAALGGKWAGLAAALHPELLLWPSLLLSETLAILLVTASLWAAFRALAAPHPLRWALAAGALCGASALTRASLLPLAALVGLWLGLAARPGAGLACLGAAVLVVAPWMVRNRLVLGAWVPVTTKAGWDLYEQCCDEADGGPGFGRVRWPRAAYAMGEVEADRFLRKEALAWIRSHPGRALSLTLERVKRTWNPVPNDAEHRTPGILALSLAVNLPLFSLAAAALLGRRLEPRLLTLALLPALLLTAVHAVFTGSVRYRAPALPGLCVLAAAGMAPRRPGTTPCP